MGRASYVQHDQVNPPHKNQAGHRVESSPAYRLHEASPRQNKNPDALRGEKGQPIVAPDYRPSGHPAEGLVEDTGQEDPGSQVDQQ